MRDFTSSFTKVAVQKMGSNVGKDTCIYYLIEKKEDHRTFTEKMKDYFTRLYQNITFEEICRFAGNTGGTVLYAVAAATPTTLPFVFLHAAGGTAVAISGDKLGEVVGGKLLGPFVSYQKRLLKYDNETPVDESFVRAVVYQPETSTNSDCNLDNLETDKKNL